MRAKRCFIGFLALFAGLSQAGVSQESEAQHREYLDLAPQTQRQVVVDRQAGQYLVRLMDNTYSADCASPGVEVLRDGTFVLTTYGHWVQGEQPYMVSVRLKISELDALSTKITR
jgi:hypothetical protein